MFEKVSRKGKCLLWLCVQNSPKKQIEKPKSEVLTAVFKIDGSRWTKLNQDNPQASPRSNQQSMACSLVQSTDPNQPTWNSKYKK